MTEIRVIHNITKLPLVELSGRVDERTGAELADKIMKKIALATDDPTEYPHPMSLPEACVRAPREGGAAV